ncbi:MAG: succinylglutamate desuccinylase [bacterium]|nr:succinylglutamate desuccinylase [bacterium]
MKSIQIIKNVIFIVLTAAICVYASGKFGEMEIPEEIFPGAQAEKIALSRYFQGIEGTNADTDVYVFDSGVEGGSVLVLGGTHPNEPAGFIAAVLLIENLNLSKGKFFIIPRANASGFTCTDPQEGVPQKYSFKTETQTRFFRYGSRFTNVLDQWPDPEVYLHYPSGQKLSGNERRNLNRSYPGKADGVLTEKLAYAIVQLIKEENIDVSIDLHEASPEYPVINAIVAHDRSMDVASIAILDLQMLNVDFQLEPSPQNFRGFSHREWGDYTDTMPFLIESANPLQGRLRGKTSAELLLNGMDKFYLEAAGLDLLYTEYPEDGIPIDVRAGRHMEAIKTIINTYSMLNPGKEIEFSDIPGYDELKANKIRYYLK